MEKNIDFTKMSRAELEDFAMKASSQAEALKQQVSFYEEQLRLMRQKKFGASSEKNQIAEEQETMSFFNDAEAEADETKEEPKIEKVKPVKKAKKKGDKQAKTQKLEKVVTEYTLEEKDRVCPTCGSEMAKMKTVVRKEIEVIPARFIEHTYLTQVYVCKECEKNGTETAIVKAPSPAPLLPASLLSPSLAAWILCRKYENRDTVYKMERDFKTAGLQLSKQTLSNWILRTAERYGKPVYERLHQHLLQESYLHADETTVEVLREDGKAPQSKSYMWIFCNGQESAHPIFLYHYAPSRSGTVPKAFLKDYRGYLQCDGYDGYNQVEQTTRIGCLAHVRRKYVDAKKGMPKGLPDAAYAAVNTGISYCDQLFDLDRQAKELPLGQRMTYKQTEVRKAMDAFFEWAEKESVQSSGLLAAAIRYTLNERAYLQNYFLDGRIELSNNRAERSVRPFVMGRKNWLFCNTPRGAEGSSVWYSLVETAKANGLKPFAYASYLLEQMRGKQPEDLCDEFLDTLLPWSEGIPDTCKVDTEEQD